MRGMIADDDDLPRPRPPHRSGSRVHASSGDRGARGRRPRPDRRPPGHGRGPLRTLVALCADGKLAMPGWVLVEYHRDVLEADCQHLPELREELEEAALARS